MDGAEAVRRAPFGNNPEVGERGANTQRRILDAALVTFRDHGYHEARVELITQEAGCSRPAFYQYFASRDDVFWALATELGRALEESTIAFGDVSPREDGVDLLEAWLTAIGALHRDYQPIFHEFPVAARSDERRGSRAQTIGQRMRERLLTGYRLPPGSTVEPEDLASAVMAMAVRSMYYRDSGIGQVPEGRLTSGVARTVHRVLHGRLDGINAGRRTGRPRGEPRPFPALPTSQSAENLRPRGRATRQKLIHAGATVLPERGYHDTRVDDIVTAAGVSHGSFYRYFGNTDDLFHVLAAEAGAAMVGLLDEFPTDCGVGEMRSWVQDWYGRYRECGGVLSVWQQMDHTDPDLASFSFEVATLVMDRLARVLDRRGFGDVTVDTITFLALIEQLPYSMLTERSITEERAVETTVHVIRRGLLGQA